MRRIRTHVVRNAPLLIAAVAAGALLAFTVIDRFRSHTKTEVVICQKVHRLDVALQQLVAESASPAALKRAAYYREHPDEIPAVIAATRRQIKRLQSADCRPAS